MAGVNVTEDQFLLEHVTEGETATVDAVALQSLIRKVRKYEREIKILVQKLEATETALEVIKNKNTYKVDIKV